MLAHNLKLLRHTMKWTQQDLANRIGVTRQTITAIESGKLIQSETVTVAILGLFTSLTLLPIKGYVVVKAVLESTNLLGLLKQMIEGEDENGKS